MKRTVLFLIDSLECGGAEKSLLSLLSMIDREHLDVYLSIVHRGGSLEKNIPSWVQLLPFPEPCRINRFLSNVLFSGCLRLLSLLGIHRHGAEIGWLCRRPFDPAFNGYFDIALAYQQGFPTYYLCKKVKALKKISWINIDMKIAGYRPKFNRPFYDRMSTICVVSEALYEIMPLEGYVKNEHLCVIRDILNVDLIQKMANAPYESHTKNTSVKLLTVGRMVPQKNYTLAVLTAERLKSLGVDYVWTFVGNGCDRNKVESLIDSASLRYQITLAGEQANPYPYYRHCDIYVQTSSFEGFGLTLSEAKILHKPIVTTNFPSAYDQIIDGENGLIAEMTPESVADKIISIIENPALKNRLIENTRKEENRTAETESEKVNQLLLED